jgi:hypothetical protein
MRKDVLRPVSSQLEVVMKVLRTLRTSALFLALGATAAASPAAATPNIAVPTGEETPPELRIYVGLWTAHFRHLGKGFDKNWLVGIAWGSVFGGTFINSYGDRAFTAGIQCTVVRGARGTVVPALGYRVGLVTGYDGRFIPIASKLPVLPVAQLWGGLERGRIGVEASWAGLVGSLGPSIRF